MKNSLHFIFKLGLFVICLIAVDQIIGYYIQKLYINQNNGPYYDLNISILEGGYDISILGSSQVKRGYNVTIISDTLGISCFNAGQDGGHSILFQYAQIISILKNGNPKVLILDTHPSAIFNSLGAYEKLSALSPYYYNIPDLRPIILLKSKQEYYKYFSKIYGYNSLIFDLIKYKYLKSEEYSVKGYVPIVNKIISDELIKDGYHEPERGSIDSTLTNAFLDMVQLCKGNEIKFIIISSPIFNYEPDTSIGFKQAKSLFDEIIIKNEIPYLNYSSDARFVHERGLFADYRHLNITGSNLFSKIVANDLKSLLMDQN